MPGDSVPLRRQHPIETGLDDEFAAVLTRHWGGDLLDPTLTTVSLVKVRIELGYR